MNQVFKQRSNKIVAFSFIGLIVVSQLWILNMGYKMPFYFNAILVLLCGLILWGMLDSRCVIEEEILKSKVGLFVQKIKIQSIEKIKHTQKGKEGSRKRMELVRIFYNGKKRLDVSPDDIEGFIAALKKIKPQIKIEKEEN